MGTTENPTTEATKPQTSNYVSTSEWIAKMKLTFNNAILPEIFEVMQTVGYDETKINSLKAQLADFENLQQVQTKEYAEQFAETDKFEQKRAEIDVVFTKQRGLLKILLKGNVHAQAILRLDELKPKAFGQWQDLVTNFYSQLESSPALLAEAAKVGISAASVTAQKQLLADLQALKESQRKETAEAQAATDVRDRAFDELYAQYSAYIKYAKVLLVDNQALEAVGVKVKAK
jgi:hypothetical protein